MDNSDSSRKSVEALVHSCSEDFYTESGYAPVRVLGKGMTGDVMLAQSRDGSNQLKAVKTFSKNTKDGGKANREVFLQEVEILQSVKHDHVLGDIMAFSDPDKYTICMPFYLQGTLKSKLPSMTSTLTDTYLVQLTSALLYLRSRQLAHRDIKPANVLIDDDRNVILCDFGLARVVTSTRMSVADVGRCGTRGYMAPELMDKTKKDFDLYKCDMYSLGVVLWNMMVGGQAAIDDVDFLQCLRSKRCNSGILRCIVEHLLDKDPKRRWDCDQLVMNLATLPHMVGLLAQTFGLRPSHHHHQISLSIEYPIH